MNNQRSPYLFCEPFAGSAALTYWLLGGKPPISYMGGKSGYSSVIADILGLSQHHKPAGIILGEPGPFAAVHATLGGASGAVEEVARWVHANALSYVKDQTASGFSHVAGHGIRFTDRHGAQGHWHATTPEVSAQRVEEVMPAARQVANIIRSWKDEEPRALWERLKAKGWPSLLLPEGRRGRWLGPANLEDVAGFTWAAMNSYRRGDPDSGIDLGDGRTNPAHNRQSGSLQAVSGEMGSLPPFPPLAVYQGFAEDLALPADLSGVICYCDPPYENTTGYKHGTCPRETVLRLARDWSARGAIVAISEAVRLDRDLGEGWCAVDISHARKGQARTFTKNQGSNRKEPQEWLTLNRPPQYVPPKQQGLFG